LKGNALPGGSRESIPVIPPAAEATGDSGIDGNNFITRLHCRWLLQQKKRSDLLINRFDLRKSCDLGKPRNKG